MIIKYLTEEIWIGQKCIKEFKIESKLFLDFKTSLITILLEINENSKKKWQK